MSLGISYLLRYQNERLKLLILRDKGIIGDKEFGPPKLDEIKSKKAWE